MPPSNSFPRSNKPDAWSVNQSLRFPFVKPRIPSLADVALEFQPAVEANWYSNFGPVSVAFERDVEANLLADGRAVTCANCTVGLSASLIALDVKGPVLIPAFTFQATASAVACAGLQAVIGDIDPATGVLSVEAVATAVREGVGAVIIVRPYGIWTDISDIAEISRRAQVPMIIDNAAGLGVETAIDDRYGVPNTIEVFSLHATKPFGVGEGGIIRTPEAFEGRARAALNFGLSPAGGNGRGLNGKMPELIAAVGLVARASLAKRVAERQAMAAFYAAKAVDAGLSHFLRETAASPWQCFAVKLPCNVSPDLVISTSLRAGLQLRRYYLPLLGANSAPEAASLSASVICLPVYDGEDAAQAAEIWEILEKSVAEN